MKTRRRKMVYKKKWLTALVLLSFSLLASAGLMFAQSKCGRH